MPGLGPHPFPSSVAPPRHTSVWIHTSGSSFSAAPLATKVARDADAGGSLQDATVPRTRRIFAAAERSTPLRREMQTGWEERRTAPPPPGLAPRRSTVREGAEGFFDESSPGAGTDPSPASDPSTPKAIMTGRHAVRR